MIGGYYNSKGLHLEKYVQQEHMSEMVKVSKNLWPYSICIYNVCMYSMQPSILFSYIPGCQVSFFLELVETVDKVVMIIRFVTDPNSAPRHATHSTHSTENSFNATFLIMRIT